MNSLAYLNKTTPALIVSILLATVMSYPLRAVVIPLGTSSADPSNYGTFSGTTLQSVTLNGITYTTGQLTQISMTSFVGASALGLLQTNAGAVNPTESERRAFIETDWSGDTGILNPSTAANSFVANFNAPVLNLPGADMFLYEVNPGTTGNGFAITINGNEVVIATTDYGSSGKSNNSDALTLGTTPTSLNELLTNTASFGLDLNQNILGVAIDFSDFGVSSGDTVSNFSLRSTDFALAVDPVIIAGVTSVPEPSTYAALLGGLVLLLAIRRKCA